MTLQQVDLLQHFFPETQQHRYFRQTMFWLMAFIISLMVVNLLQLGYWQWLEAQTPRYQKSYEKATEQERDAYQQLQQAVRQNGSLSEVDVRYRELEKKKSVHHFLQAHWLSHQSFTSLLVGLSKATIEGVWLSEIVIDNEKNQLHLQGVLLKTELLPEYLQSLRKQPQFQGVDFSLLDLRKTGRHYQFVLDTQYEKSLLTKPEK